MARPSGQSGALLIKTGLLLYDFLAGRNSRCRGTGSAPAAALVLRPALNPE